MTRPAEYAVGYYACTRNPFRDTSSAFPRHLRRRLHPHLSLSSQLHLMRAICMFEETCGQSSSCFVRICHYVLLIMIKNYTQYQLYVFSSSLEIGIVNRNSEPEHAVIVNGTRAPRVFTRLSRPARTRTHPHKKRDYRVCMCSPSRFL